MKRSYSGVLAAAAAAAFSLQASWPAAADSDQSADSVISTRVRAALANDHQLVARNIEVSVEGGVVHLRGRVESEQDLRLAELDAKSVPGVTGVANNIELKSSEQDRSR